MCLQAVKLWLRTALGGVSVEQVVTGDVAVSSPALRAVLECIPGPVEPPGKVRPAGT